MNEAMLYDRTQVGSILMAGNALLIFGLLLLSKIDEARASGLIVAGVLAFFILIFGWMRVRVGEGLLDVRMGIGFVRRRVPLAEIRSARAVRNSWMHGWGLRYAPWNGWTFNVQGLDAVEVVLASGRRFRVGTDDPQGLEQAIVSRLAR